MESQRRLRWFGVIALAFGVCLSVGAAPLGGELSGLMRGYGLMLAASAGYMLTGLWLLGVGRARRRAPHRQPQPRRTSPQP
jgi:drug/metabolite transporter (DMT)-like permease